MTNETNHTPTPWDQLNDVFTIEDGYFSMIQTPDKCIANVFDEANAAHIVKCVNMHDDLVGALKKIIDRSHNDPLGTSKVIDMRKIAEKALKKAGAL